MFVRLLPIAPGEDEGEQRWSDEDVVVDVGRRRRAAAPSDGRRPRRPNKLRWLSPRMISLREGASQSRLDLHESERHPGKRSGIQGAHRPPFRPVVSVY